MATSSSASASTSTSHGNTNTYIYDVFVNHRGPDVKEGLATLLYQGLNKKGFRVFLDREEMQAGEKLSTQIEGAIRQASVHLAIFSPNYASSPWCLKELVLMEETNGTIIPIFYGVDPSALRWTQAADGLYGRALHKLEGRHDSNTINKWRNALSNAAGISGYKLSEHNNNEVLLIGEENVLLIREEELKKLDEQLVRKVIERVSAIASKTPWNVARYPTGLADKVKELETIVELSRQQSEKVATAVGIAGLGGLGKTTIAKQFFNSERSNYERSSFLLDVREEVAKNHLNRLQVQLLEDLTQRKFEKIKAPDEGIGMLERYLPSSHRALVVLDDVDHIDQLHALFSPLKETIHSSSLILVTSRNKDALTNADIVESSIYMPKGLNQEHSKELFCRHAFNQPDPVEGFEQLVQKYLDACGGLPLALKVIGALLRGNRDSNNWQKLLQKICETPPMDIRSRLKISYDGLDEEEKQIFLDIACFFIGEERDTAIRIWDGSRWQGCFGFRYLENRCLVEVDNQNRIRMHDQLRDLGRYLAKNSENPGRLWRLRDNPDLSNHSFLRGIHMVHGNGTEQSFEDLADGNDAEQSLEDLAGTCNMSKLQLLRAEGDFVERVFSVGDLRQLIYLHWDKCLHSSLPPSIPIKNLRVLHIQGAYLKTLWQDESQAPLQLRELVIHGRIQRIPESIGKLKQLEKFALMSPDIKTFPGSLGILRNLQRLNPNLHRLELTSCPSLQMLPDSFGNMTNLQSLDLTLCYGLQMLPDSIGNMTNLQSLGLSQCFNLKMLPDWIGNMTNLQSLDLCQCYPLQMLPDSIGNMTNLQSLNLRWCSRLQMLPDSIGNMTNLQSLDLRKCYGLQMLPDSIGNMTNLQSLDLRKCDRLQMLPDSIGNMTNLQSLDLRKCYGLQMLPDSIGNMTNLQSLDLRCCSDLQMLPDSIGNMTNLQSLDLRWCSHLQMLPDSIGNMTNLQSLYLKNSYCLKMLPDSIGNMTNLQSLYLFHCFYLKMLPDSVGNMTNLQSLDLRECYSLQMLPDSVGNMTNLESLHLQRCCNLHMLPNVEHVRSLRYLDVRECAELQWGAGVVEQLRQRRNFTLIEGSGEEDSSEADTFYTF